MKGSGNGLRRMIYSHTSWKFIGKRNEETGEIKWLLKLKPMESKEVDLKYSLKYPRNQSIILD